MNAGNHSMTSSALGDGLLFNPITYSPAGAARSRALTDAARSRALIGAARSRALTDALSRRCSYLREGQHGR
jgi:hypothetical protein